MPKRTAAFELTLPPRQGDEPAYVWLYEALRQEILGGRLRSGARLPATRDLARQHGLSRGTVVRAFEQLHAEGYIEGATGSGTFVCRVLPEELLRVERRPAARGPALAPPTYRLSSYARALRLFPYFAAPPTRAFRCHLPALDLFPIDIWTQLVNRRLRRASTSLLMGCGPLGYLPLREAIAGYLASSRGVRCSAGQVVIVSGAQEALDLCARLLLDAGDAVCIENPGYTGAMRAFAAAGARMIAAEVDEQGMRVPAAGSSPPVRLVYVTPAHQFPLGATMSVTRRLELLQWAATAGALIFEDDYDSEFRYSGRPVPALQSFDRAGRVIFAGTFSKVLFPSLRLGYMVAPPELVETVEAAKSVSSRHAPLLDQAVVCDFITGGHFGRHLRRMREIYSGRLAVLMESAQEHLGGLLEISGIEAGLQTVGWLRNGMSGEAAARAAAARNIDVTPLGIYYQGTMPQQGLHLGFAAVDEREIRRGARELAQALQGGAA